MPLNLPSISLELCPLRISSGKTQNKLQHIRTSTHQHNMKKLFTLLFLLAVLFSSAQMELLDSLSQAEKPKVEYVAYTFKSTRVISGQSVETDKKNAIDFRVVHRFGDMFAAKADNYHNLFGFDQASDIGIIVDYGITSDLSIGVGRMKGGGTIQELWNGGIKYKLLKQTTDFRIPFTISVFGNTCITSMLSSGDSTSIDYYPKTDLGFAHRLSYVLEAMVASKITRWLSLQVSSTFVWRNYVAYSDQNGIDFLGLSGRAKVSNRTSIVWEYYLPIVKDGEGGRYYFPTLRGIKNASYYPPAQIGMEFETGGHVFDVNISNSTGILENDFLPNTNKNWLQGEFRLGFTISRVFQIGEKPGKYWKKGSVEDSK